MDSVKKNDKILFLFVSLCLVLFCSFRYGGFARGDYFAYLFFSEKLLQFDDVLNSTLPVEIGFRFVSFVGNYFDMPSEFVIFVMGLLSVIPVVIVILKYSKYKFFSILLFLPYFFTMNMHTARTSVSGAFALLFIFALFERKYFLSVIYVSLALSFHTLSIVLLFIVLSLFSINTLLISLLFVFVFSIVVNPFILISHLLNFAGFSSILGKITSYASSESYSGVMHLYDPRVIVVFLVVFLFLCVRNKLTDSLNSYLTKVYIIGGIVMISFSFLVVMSWRASYLFLLVGVIYIPNICYVHNINLYERFSIRRIMTFLVSIVYIVWCLLLISSAQDYSMIFFPSPNIE
ncbi:EpsG family protein [Vibrio cyclitrophicus]|uniref:EpsG family protein n=1 Tax=Vibrio cyclitrophicus TaxID=47951 RepID=UPI001055CB0A|nr:EpsG family protein [Vibrio cyclitrophicus]